MRLNDRLELLDKLGCYPHISKRGKGWRAHINGAGNYWDDGETPAIALESAFMAWDKAGRPMDGYAVTS